MKIVITKGKDTVSVERGDSTSMEDIIEGFVSCLFVLGYEYEEIRANVVKAAEILKNNHNESDKDISTIRL